MKTGLCSGTTARLEAKRAVIFSLFAFFLSNNYVSGQTAVNVAITPQGTIGACQNNLYKAEFTASGLHQIIIDADILFVTGNPTNSCSGIPVTNVFIVFESANVTVTNISNDTVNGTWTGKIDTTGPVELLYHIYVDCAVINTATSGQNVDLKQTWTDSTGNFTYTLTGVSNTFTSSTIATPLIVNSSPNSYWSSYLDTTYLYFYFSNNNFGTANILFNFIPDTSYCGQFPMLALEYATSPTNTFMPWDMTALQR